LEELRNHLVSPHLHPRLNKANNSRALWVLFVVLTIICTNNWKDSAVKSGFLLIPREKAKKHAIASAKDEEAQTVYAPRANQSRGSDTDETRLAGEGKIDDQLIRNTSVFTWKNLSYTVKTPSGDRVLLDNVQGWVKPGMLGALMGSSGAGKTTLLDVLAQRKTDGTIHGSILVDGRPLSISFQRSAGYCEQLDVHEPLATVREALEFSALLRQSRTIPTEEKLRYVETIIDLLEMHDIENTLIGTAGAGLSIEQRKRLTIGVELVSKPSILIFLDEPTSGLDGQAAFNIVRFLRKLADVGQAVLVTIHQPSAQLFAQFDSLLLLASGGKTVYFGDIGDNAETLKEYFARHGAPCPAEANPAEHMIDVVSGRLSQGKDWNEVWLSSPEHAYTITELDRIISTAAANPPGTVDDGLEFAMPLWEQIKLVTKRMNVSIYRNTDYINNKLALHIGSALFNGFSFWKIGHSIADLQLRLFTVFNFIFVAPGVIAQLQPLFIERRDIYETREKKSKMYSWVAFVTGLIVSELPYLCICAVLYFVCWYYTVGFPTDSSSAGATFFVMLMVCTLFLPFPLSPIAFKKKKKTENLTILTVRICLHRNRPIRRRLCAQRRLRFARQPRRHRSPRLLLRRARPLFPNPAFLALLALLPQPLQLPHGLPTHLHLVLRARVLRRCRIRHLQPALQSNLRYVFAGLSGRHGPVGESHESGGYERVSGV